MLGMLVNHSMPYAPNTWKFWVDHIMKHKKDFGFKKAMMVHNNGNTASSSAYGFLLTSNEILRLKQHFDEGCEKETVSLLGKTYIVKSRSANQLIVFNGNKYFIISKSLSMYIIVLCESRSKCEAGATWLRRINAKLIEKEY